MARRWSPPGLPLLRHCLGDDELEHTARQWRQGELSLAEWCQSLVSRQQLHPLFHHWLRLQGQASMRGLRMNTLGWFDFKSELGCKAGTAHHAQRIVTE